jgi:hypothetical protein
MGTKSLDLIHKYTNPQLIFDLVKVVSKTQTLSKRFVVQHHKLIINKHKFEVQQLLLCKKQYYL